MARSVEVYITSAGAQAFAPGPISATNNIAQSISGIVLAELASILQAMAMVRGVKREPASGTRKYAMRTPEKTPKMGMNSVS